MKKTSFILILISLFHSVSNKAALAQIGTLSPPPAAKFDLTTVVSTFLQFALGSGIVVFFILFMWGSIQWLTSEGEKAHLTAARARLTSAAIGLILLSSIWAIFEIVKAITFKP